MAPPSPLEIFTLSTAWTISSSVNAIFLMEWTPENLVFLTDSRGLSGSSGSLSNWERSWFSSGKSSFWAFLAFSFCCFFFKFILFFLFCVFGCLCCLFFSPYPTFRFFMSTSLTMFTFSPSILGCVAQLTTRVTWGFDWLAMETWFVLFPESIF